MTKKMKIYLDKLRREKPKSRTQELRRDKAEMDEIKSIEPGQTMYGKDIKGLSWPKGFYIDVKQEVKKKEKIFFFRKNAKLNKIMKRSNSPISANKWS